MNTPVIIIGAGGHAKVLLEALLRSNVQVIGLLDADQNVQGTLVLGVPVIGGDEVVGRYQPEEIRLVNGMGSIGNTSHRTAIYACFKQKGYYFATVIHPSAVIAEDVAIGEGSQIMAGVILQPGVTVGSNTIINTSASIDHDCHIGNHVHLAPGVTLSGNVRIGNHTHVGTGVTIIQGIDVGSHSVIGSGAVVVRDVPANVTALGVPAKVVNR